MVHAKLSTIFPTKYQFWNKPAEPACLFFFGKKPAGYGFFSLPAQRQFCTISDGPPKNICDSLARRGGSHFLPSSCECAHFRDWAVVLALFPTRNMAQPRSLTEWPSKMRYQLNWHAACVALEEEVWKADPAKNATPYIAPVQQVNRPHKFPDYIKKVANENMQAIFDKATSARKLRNLQEKMDAYQVPARKPKKKSNAMPNTAAKRQKARRAADESTSSEESDEDEVKDHFSMALGTAKTVNRPFETICNLVYHNCNCELFDPNDEGCMLRCCDMFHMQMQNHCHGKQSMGYTAKTHDGKSCFSDHVTELINESPYCRVEMDKGADAEHYHDYNNEAGMCPVVVMLYGVGGMILRSGGKERVADGNAKRTEKVGFADWRHVLVSNLFHSFATTTGLTPRVYCRPPSCVPG